MLLFVITMHPWCTGCFLCVWEVSLTDARSPWCPGWCPSGWGSLPAGWGSLLACWVRSCPLGEGLCLPVGSCLPTSLACTPGEGLCLPLSLSGPCMPLYPFPFCRKGYYINVPLAIPDLFPFYHRVVSRDDMMGLACTQISLLFSLLSLGVYQGVFLCYLGMPIPRYLPSKEKKLWTHLKLSIKLSKYHLKIVHKCTNLFKLSHKCINLILNLSESVQNS